MVTFNILHVSVVVHFLWLLWLSFDVSVVKQQLSKIDNIVSDIVPENFYQSSTTYSNHDSTIKEDGANDLSSPIPEESFLDGFQKLDKKKDFSNRDFKIDNFLFEEIKKYHTNLKAHDTNIPTEIIESFHHPKSRALQPVQNIETKCLLMSYDDSTFIETFVHEDIPDFSSVFKLTLKMMTDKFPWELSWSLSSLDKSDTIIDSRIMTPELDLLPDTLQTMEYSCYVSSTKEEGNLDEGEICYDFIIEDAGRDGLCCWSNMGYYSLTLQDNDSSLVSGRFFSLNKETSFCLDNRVVSKSQAQGNGDTNEATLYPSKECLNDICICDSNPDLFSNYDDIESKIPSLRELKTHTLMNIIILSGSDNLQESSSPQYMAACWTLNDDPYLTQYSNTTVTKTSDAERRMMQRYILAVFYFSTNGQNWSRHLNFLSSKSECEWHQDKVFGFFTIGAQCDENSHISSLLFYINNIDGPIVNELSGLKSLEFITFAFEPLHGTIPKSIGRLSELRVLSLVENFYLEGSIPEEIFHEATKLESLFIRGSPITGSIPETIQHAKDLQVLDLQGNMLTNSIPDGIFSLTQLRRLFLNDNLLSSTISSLVGNLQHLRNIRLFGNRLTGTIPNSLGSVSTLEEINFSKNTLTGEIPESFQSFSNIVEMNLFETNLTGEVPLEICEIEPKPLITADCRNDIFPTKKLSCSCCAFCINRTPSWDGPCPDSYLRFVIDHVIDRANLDSFWLSSELLEWSITDVAADKKIMSDGPYKSDFTLKPSYEACIASSDCFSLQMKSEPLIKLRSNADLAEIDFKTNYSIYWNDKLVLNDTYEMNIYNKTIQQDVLFHYDELTDEIQVGDVCPVKEFVCDGNIISLDPTQRIMYNTALKISGTPKLDDDTTPQSRALCWMLDNDEFSSYSKDMIEKVFTQRYVLTLLHLSSESNLFGSDTFPPQSNECEWEGCECADGLETVTSLSLNGNKKIGGTLIEEIGSLAFLQVLHLKQSMLKGIIPPVFSNLYSLKELDLSGNALTGTIPPVFSNLYSLKELDLSGNELTGTIPQNFFSQLEVLELFDASDNDLIGEISISIGSSSKMKTIKLNKNKFIGNLPLDEFADFSLVHLDVSENQLAGEISPLLLWHFNLEHLNLGANFFVGNLGKTTFSDLLNLKYFNVSKNELTGIIPHFNPDKNSSSNVTHLDMHANRFTGTLSASLAQMTSLEYCNLQGNEIIGSIPFEVNNLKNLHTLVLSHNRFKGKIPIQLNELVNVNRLHLHGNQLTGVAPDPVRAMDDYISDCGFPSVSLEPVECPSCSICCNSENMCQNNTRPSFTPLIFFLSVVIFLAIIYSMKKRIMQSRSLTNHFENHVAYWRASDLIGEKSVYHFFLTPNKVGWLIGLGCAIAQLLTLFLFVRAGDIAAEDSDLEYTITCSENNLECENERSLSTYGRIIFFWVLFVWLMRDIVGSVKLFILAMWSKIILPSFSCLLSLLVLSVVLKNPSTFSCFVSDLNKGINIDFLFASIVIFFVTFFSVWTSIYYNLATATKNTDLIVNAVVLLFVNELDERLYQLAHACNLEWVEDVHNSMRMSHNTEARNLVLTTSINQALTYIRNG